MGHSSRLAGAPILSTGASSSQDYWDRRYITEGRIWGEQPSLSASVALEIFCKAEVKTVLVPGSGYGRHTAYLSKSGFTVTGIEISPVAVNLARQLDTVSRFYTASVLDISSEYSTYDAVFCFNVLHLFWAEEREVLIRLCAAGVKTDGLMFFTAFSEKEADFGKGIEVEKNTFETRPGRPAHYFTEDDLRQHFGEYPVIDIGIIKDPEDHGGKPHIHLLRYICVRVNNRFK
jgi:SAM-dependent methyltransferase